MQQDVHILELADHLVGVGDEVRREVAAVELHSLHDIDLGVETLVLLDRDDALVAHLLHGIGDLLANCGFAIRGNRSDLRDLLRALHRPGSLLDVLHGPATSNVDAALEVHGVHPRGHGLQALVHNVLGQHRRGRGSVARHVVGLRRDLSDHLRAHVLEPVLKLDFLRDGHAVLGDSRRAERLLEKDVPPLRAEGVAHRVGESVDSTLHQPAGFVVEFHLFGSHG